ncbi:MULTISPECIES: HEAT repeat domain-containing protein [unclassified Micromonospora]|uniref:HEAT repeat domain-containing protein n=1 Tax=unclassified Micromonospora TaxID=2617518 RepID=UPI003325291A
MPITNSVPGGLTEAVRALADPEPERRREAHRTLVAAGSGAVAPLIAGLLDEESPVDWAGAAGSVLREIGAPAFEPLVAAIAAATTVEVRRRCGWAFQGFGVELLDAYAAALSHPSPHVRQDAALGLQYRGAAAVPAVPALLPLLADPDPDVRQRAVWALSAIGAGALPALHEIRRHGPGRLRAGALRAIAELAGEPAFSAPDRAAVERLIRIKLLAERPGSVAGRAPCGSWLALPTGDQAAVLDALELSDPRPATLRLGYAASAHDSHCADDRYARSRVFVTPELNGWTLVLGPWYAFRGGPKREAETCRALSEQFGAAQSYWYDARGGGSAWLICAAGEVLRQYDDDKPKRSVGARLPVEEGLLLPHEEPDIPDEAWASWDHAAPDADERWAEIERRYGVPDTCDALTVAAAMSVDPAGLGPDTDMRGHGLLALTKVGRKHGVAPGALPI